LIINIKLSSNFSQIHSVVTLFIY